MNKNIIKAAILGILALSLFVGCTSKPSTTATTAKDKKTSTIIKVGASSSPHAEILEQIKGILQEKGYNLEIVEFSDYVQPNLAVESGELDANYFQHQPYLDSFNKEKGTNVVSVAAIHYEPFGIYSKKITSLKDVPNGGSVAVPNDTTNEARALLLLEAQGIIKLKENVGLNATKKDIIENPKSLKIIEVEAAQVPHSLQDVDIAVINGNYALDAGLKVGKDALATEDAASIATTTYANIVAVKGGNEKDEEIKALVDALQSETISAYIKKTYEGAVVPLS